MINKRRIAPLLNCIAGLLAVQAVPFASGDMMWQDAAQQLSISTAADDQHSGSAAQRRVLAQAGGVCPATEYFCGADDLFLDSAFQALGSAACTEDTGGSPPLAHPPRVANVKM